MDLSPLSSKVHNYQDSLDRTILSILSSIRKNNRIVIDDRLTTSTRSKNDSFKENDLEGGCSSLRPVHRLADELLIFRLPWLVASIVENYSCATGPFNPVHEYGRASTTRKSGRCEPPFKTGSLDYRQKSSLPRRSICVVSYMPSYPIFEALMESCHSHRARVSRGEFRVNFHKWFHIYYIYCAIF